MTNTQYISCILVGTTKTGITNILLIGNGRCVEETGDRESERDIDKETSTKGFHSHTKMGIKLL